MKPQKRQKPKSSFGYGAGPVAGTIAALMATVAIVAPARAAVLRGWMFDTNSQQLTLTLPAGVTPDFFLLAQPARIVLDVPQTTLGEVSRSQQYSGAVRSIRLSESQAGARFVVELAPNTRLDPRHAELTAVDAGNGQTRWTLKPLIQDANSAPVATVTPPSPTAPAAPVVASPPARPPAPTPAPPAPVTAPAATAVSAPAPAITAASPSPSLPTVAVPATPTPAVELPTQPLPTPAPVAAPTLPAVANSATTGAVQGLPGPDPLQGVRTDAAALAGVGADNVSDVPPEQLPIDPFASSTQAAVSVPPLSAAPAATPQVSVPSLAAVPDELAAPPVPPAAPPGVVPNQVRPPGSAPIATPPGPPAAPVAVPNQVDAPVAAAPPAAPIAVTAIDIPTIPLPPENWREPEGADAGAIAANQVPPPGVESVAPASVAPPVSPLPPDASAPSATGATPPAPPAMSPSVPAPAIVPPPPSIVARADTLPPPAPAATESLVITAPPPSAFADAPFTPPPSLPAPMPLPPEGSVGGAPLPPPPFLQGTGTVPPNAPPNIPPPPPVPTDDGTVPFGAPLPPQTKSVDSDRAVSLPISEPLIPVGTRLRLQYSGAEPLVLEQQEPLYEVLIVAGDVYHPQTRERVIASGTPILGRFEGFDESGRRFVTQIVMEGSSQTPLLAESDWLVGTADPSPANIALGSGIGAAAVTVLGGLSGVGLLTGAAIGAAAAVTESPQVVRIEPGQFIEVEVVADILPFNDAPTVAPRF